MLNRCTNFYRVSFSGILGTPIPQNRRVRNISKQLKNSLSEPNFCPCKHLDSIGGVPSICLHVNNHMCKTQCHSAYHRRKTKYHNFGNTKNIGESDGDDVGSRKEVETIVELIGRTPCADDL